ncbi:MAG TPA: hypothetical protein V6D17_08365 [Candidatus Obscuribacterales bacterium]
MTDLEKLLSILSRGGVEFIIVGGTAATAHGSARLTFDLDIVYNRSPENIEKLVKALSPFSPYMRGAPPGLPFVLDEATIRRGLNFTLTTSLGDLDLLGEIAGGGTYKDLLPYSVPLTVFGETCLCIGLERLIQVKRAAGRPKDLEAIAELESLLDETAPE